MGFLDKLLGKKPAAAAPAPARENLAADKTCAAGVVYAPVEGEVIPLAAVDDEVFSSECLGKGVAVKPAKGVVCAPFDGKLTTVAATGHAIGILSKDGVEVLIHVGMDTVELNGEGYTVLCKVDDEVKKGDVLVKFDMAFISGKGYQLTTPIVVTNTDDYADVSAAAEGAVAVGDAVINIK